MPVIKQKTVNGKKIRLKKLKSNPKSRRYVVTVDGRVVDAVGVREGGFDIFNGQVDKAKGKKQSGSLFGGLL